MNNTEEQIRIADVYENKSDSLLKSFNRMTELFSDLGYRTEDHYDTIDRHDAIMRNGAMCNIELKCRDTCTMFEESYVSALEMERLINDYHRTGKIPLVMMFFNFSVVAIWDLRNLPTVLNYHWQIERNDRSRGEKCLTNRVGLPKDCAWIYQYNNKLQNARKAR